MWQKAHVGLAAVSFRRERQTVVDFVGKIPVAVEEINFYVPGRPQASMDEMEALLTPFDKNVWIYLGLYTGLGLVVTFHVCLKKVTHFPDPSRSSVIL